MEQRDQGPGTPRKTLGKFAPPLIDAFFLTGSMSCSLKTGNSSKSVEAVLRLGIVKKGARGGGLC